MTEQETHDKISDVHKAISEFRKVLQEMPESRIVRLANEKNRVEEQLEEVVHNLLSCADILKLTIEFGTVPQSKLDRAQEIISYAAKFERRNRQAPEV